MEILSGIGEGHSEVRSRIGLLAGVAVIAAFTGFSNIRAEDPTPKPSELPAVAWMLKASPLPKSDAATADEMKAYTETIPGSDAKFEMLPIPGGTFVMGSPEDEADREKDEGPQVKVEIAPFWMCKCEVTWDKYELWAMGMDQQRREILKQTSTEYDKLADAITMPTKPYTDMTFGMGRDGYPAICMTQLAAKMYCKWLSAKTGRYYRLPTEAEWEYACRAGTDSVYSFGDDVDDLEDYGWYYDNAEDAYHPVGEKKPNAWGLYDMHGNVAEWVLDAYTEDGYGHFGKAPFKNPLNVPKTLFPRTVRGGSWFDDPEECRSAARMSSTLDWKQQDPQIPQSVWYHTDADFVGFRLVRPLTVPSVEQAKRYDIDKAQLEDMLDYMEIKGDSL